MNFEQALTVVQAAVKAQVGRQLREVETAIFLGSWQGQTYEEIAEDSGYAVSYLKRDVGPKFWKLLGNALGKAVNKTNFKAALKQQWQLSSSQAYEPIALSGQAAANPCSSTPDSNFVGRERAIAHLNTLVSSGAKVILIQGKGGVGKTKLASEYLKRFDLVLPAWMAKDYENVTSATSLVEEWLRRYFNEEPGREFGITLERLRQQLQNPTKTIGVLIDNLEPALDGNGKFREPHRPYVELLRVLASEDVRSITLITSRESLHEAAVNVRHYHLEGLDVAAWQEFFSSRHIQIDSTMISAMHSSYGGNAKAMSILLGAIQEDYSGNLVAYWQTIQEDLLLEGDLRDLVVTQFNRLEQIDPRAYQLLYRLGCYRFSDVPSVPIEGVLCLLWDVPEAQRRRVVKSLQERSLVEFSQSEYWLHPVIRAEAIARLRASEDWQTANHQAAEFWTTSVETVETTVDALIAMEAYYHYLEINDFEQAATVIVKERANQWQNDEHLGSSFFRLGLLHQMTTAITQIIKKIKPRYLLSELYSILGGLYGMRGETQESIKCFVESGLLARKCLKTLPKSSDYAQDSHYPQVKAKALSGLAEFYRKQEDFETGLSKHKDAIELLEKIGAKCDLAEAYYQLGLTYQKMGDTHKSWEKFQVSIQLFSQIYAPLQVERVQRTMESKITTLSVRTGKTGGNVPSFGG